MEKKRYQYLLFVLVGLAAINVKAQEAKYPPLSEYLMARDAEIALAKRGSGLRFRPRDDKGLHGVRISNRARGGQRFCVHCHARVYRSSDVHSGPSPSVHQLRRKNSGSHLSRPNSARTLLPYYELRTKLGLEGKTAEQIAEGAQAAYAKGEIPKRPDVCFAYMWSADQVLGPVGHWPPHIMVYLPYYATLLGTRHPQNPLPAIGDDEGTPFAVGTIPVDDKLAIKARP